MTDNTKYYDGKNALLYLISPPEIDNLTLFAGQLETALQVGGDDIGAFQLRLKAAGQDKPLAGKTTLEIECEEKIAAAIEVLLPITQKHKVAFILNDSLDLAMKYKLSGVHLGLENSKIAEARAIAGDDFIIGATCHNSYHLAMEAAENGADYVAFGAFYPTTSKTAEALAKWQPPTVDLLKDWSELSEIPCVAIGGITPDNCSPLISSGADFIAVINAVWNAEGGVEKAINDFTKNLR